MKRYTYSKYSTVPNKLGESFQLITWLINRELTIQYSYNTNKYSYEIYKGSPTNGQNVPCREI